MTVSQTGATFLPFPTKEYTQSGFYQNIARKNISSPFAVTIRFQPQLTALPHPFLYSICTASFHVGTSLPDLVNDPINSPRKRTQAKGADENDVSHGMRHRMVLVYIVLFFLLPIRCIDCSIYKLTLFQFKLCMVARVLGAFLHLMYSVLLLDCGYLNESNEGNIDRNNDFFRRLFSSICCGLPGRQCRINCIGFSAPGNSVYLRFDHDGVS